MEMYSAITLRKVNPENYFLIYGRIIYGIIEHPLPRGTLTPEHENQIKQAIEHTKYYDLSRDTRFFVTNGFRSTRIQKSTSGGIWGARYLSITELTGRKPSPNATLDEVAQLLEDRQFA